MSSVIQSLKEQSRKDVTSPFTQATYRIKSISQIEFSRKKIQPIMPADDKSDVDDKLVARFLLDREKRTLDMMQFVLETAVVQPKIFFGEEKDMPPDQAHADWIAKDEAWLYNEIMKFSGLDDESQKALEALLKNGNGSGIATPSVTATASGPMS